MKNIKKTLKLKDIIVNHIASNSKEYIIVTLLFIIGIFLGVLFVNNIKMMNLIVFKIILQHLYKNLKKILI